MKNPRWNDLHRGFCVTWTVCACKNRRFWTAGNPFVHRIRSVASKPHKIKNRRLAAVCVALFGQLFQRIHLLKQDHALAPAVVHELLNQRKLIFRTFLLQNPQILPVFVFQSLFFRMHNLQIRHFISFHNIPFWTILPWCMIPPSFLPTYHTIVDQVNKDSPIYRFENCRITTKIVSLQ